MKNLLTINEKHIIQSRLHQGEDIKDIAKSINRKSKTVQHYVDNELDQVHETIANAQLQEILDDTNNESDLTKELLDEENSVTYEDEHGQEQEIDMTPQPPKAKRKPKNTGFINQTSSGTKGLAISTSAASAISDAMQKTYPKQISRTARGNLYKINEQEVQE